MSRPMHMSIEEHEAHRKRIREAVEYLVSYWKTYDQQAGYEDYFDETVINDALYGLGVALWGEEHKGPSGFDRTVAKIQAHLENHR